MKMINELDFFWFAVLMLRTNNSKITPLTASRRKASTPIEPSINIVEILISTDLPPRMGAPVYNV